MSEISWGLAAGLAASGIVMGLISCLVGMRPKVENPMWWLVYAIWVVIVLAIDAPAPFLTILFASIAAGLLHGLTSSALLDQYIANNPWHADRMQAPKGKLAGMFVLMGLIVGAAFGAIAGAIALGLSSL